MNYYLRKNGSVSSPMQRPDFDAKLASGEYSATDEMSTDGVVWTRLGLTGFAKSVRDANFASVPAVGRVVRDLTRDEPPPGADPSATTENLKTPAPERRPVPNVPTLPRPSPAKKAVPAVVILLLAALGALAWFLTRAPEPEPRPAVSAENPEAAVPAADGGAEPAGPAKKAVSMDDPLVQKAIFTYLAPSAESLETLLVAIERSEHVRSKFADVAASTRFEYLPDDDLVNAESRFGLGEDGETRFGRILLYGGLVRMSRLMGAVLCFGEPARTDDENVLLGFLRDLGATLREAGNRCSTEDMLSMLDRHAVDPEGFTALVRRSAAEKIANAIVEAIMAHEFGHLAKGHLNGGDANHQVSQIEEKEADLFAATIAASIPEGPEVFAGQVLSMIVFSFIDDGTGERLRTHPVARERVIDAIRANPEFAEAAGLTEEGVRAFYKSLDAKKAE